MIVALLTGLAAAVAMMILVWIASVLRRDASIVDSFWGLGFALLGWVYFLTIDAHTLRGVVVVFLVTVWGLRLTAHITWRNWGEGEDYRYRAMRARWGGRFPWVSLFTVFLLQALILWAISTPLFQAQQASLPRGLAVLDWLGLGCFAVGLFFEAVGDWQLARFRAEPTNKGEVLDRGLWRYTRHPNYFGDAMVWWGFFCFALATPGSLWTLYSPLAMTLLLLKVSGVSLLEQKLRDSRPGYRDYVRRTSAFVPWFPKR